MSEELRNKVATSTGPAMFKLGPVDVNPDRNEVKINGETTRLKPKVMQVLVRLADGQGEVVTKNDLMDSVWPSMSVSDSVLTEAIHELRRALGDSASKPQFIQTIPRRGYQIVATISAAEPARSTESRKPRIAVSRFRSLTADPEDDYFCEGLCEELTNSLGRIRHVDVLARTSTLEALSSNELSSTLGATHIVDGTLRRDGSRIRVIARVSDASTDVQLWSAAFDGTLEDIVAVQDDMAGQIGAALAPQFEVEAGPALETPHMPNPEAFRAFSKGRYFWKRDNSNPAPALTHYESAIRTDPAYAAPYAGMVECFNTLGVFHLVPIKDAREASIRYAEQALFLEPGSPESLFAFGYTQFYMRWNWPGAEAAFLKCLSINPNHSIAHSFLSLLYSALGRHDESLQHTDAAKRLDPFSTLTWWLGFLHFHYARDYDSGLKTARRGLELHPDDVLINWAIADSLVRLGRTDEAASAVDRLYELTAEFPLYRACSGILYSILGRPDIARQIEADLGLDRAEVEDPFICGLLAIYIDQPDRALSMLELAEELQDPLIWVISRDPYYDPIRGEPRFRELLQRLNLPADNLPMER